METTTRLPGLLVTACLLASCGSSEHDASGEPSGATCPTGSTLTYDTFGQSFMGQYCTRCHAEPLTGAARSGAPSDHDLDTLAAIQSVGAEHIDLAAAAGPSHVNTSMPPADGGPQPSEAERRLLGEWLACGLP